MQLAETATQECPIVLERCVVWVNEDKRTRLEKYEYTDCLWSLNYDRHSVILFDDKIQEAMMSICKCRTTSKNPLYIKTLSDYILLPGNAPAGLYKFICSPNTFGHVIKQLKIKHPGKDYQVKYLGKAVAHDRLLAEAFKPPFKGKYCISPISDYVYDIQFSTSASGLVSSQAKKQEVLKNMKSYPLFADSFTMKLHRYTNNDSEFKFASGVQEILTMDAHAQLRFSRGKLPEKTYTSILSSALQDFLKPVGHSCFHQCTLYDDSFPDIYVASMQSSLPQWPKLIEDFKKDSMDDAKVQTFRYCLSMVNQSDKVYPLLAMPCVCKKFHLTLCVPEAEGKLAYIKIVEAKVHDEKELARFFAIMRFGVQLLEPSSFANNPITFKPMPGLHLSIRKKLNHCVFHLFNDHVCKMYEGTLFGSPNEQLIERCLGENYLPHMEVTSFIGDDDYFQMFSYDCLTSKEFCPQDLNYFRDIAIAIDHLHAEHTHSTF